MAGWFSTQWHAVRSSVQTIAEINELLYETEVLVSRAKHETKKKRKDPCKSEDGLTATTSYIDVVIISHEFTDHCHKSTLLEVDPSVPVLATKKAAALIRSWKHFNKVMDVATFTYNMDWRTTTQEALPSWLGISRLITKSDALYYHSAIVICFKDGSGSKDAEAVIYTPHGVHAQSFDTILSSNPLVRPLAFLHGLHDVSITLSKQLNLGAYNALKAQEILHSKYWVGTHDEVKIGGGLIAPFLRRKAYTLLEVLGRETPGDGKDQNEVEPKHNPDVSYVDLRSGESLLLA